MRCPSRSSIRTLVPVAVLGSLLVLCPDAAGDVLTAGVFPAYFSPNGDGVREQCRIRLDVQDSARVWVQVRSEDGLQHLWLTEEVPQEMSVGGHTLVWAGEDSLDSLFPDGIHTVFVRAHGHSSGDSVSVGLDVVLDTARPEVVSLGMRPNPFDPEAPHPGAATVTFSADDYSPDPGGILALTIRHVDSTHVSPDTLQMFEFHTEHFDSMFYWDGTSGDENLRQDGLHSLGASAVDWAGNESERYAVLVDIDRRPPELTLEPERLILLPGEEEPTSLTVTAYDRNLDPTLVVAGADTAWPIEITYALDDAYIAGDDTAKFHVSAVDTAANPPDEDEEYEYLVYGYDELGHSHTQGGTHPPASFTVRLNAAPPVHASTTTPDGNYVFGNGDQITLLSEWDGDWYRLTADFGALDSEFDSSGVEVSSGEGGVYTITYTISGDNTFGDADNLPITITAVDTLRIDAGLDGETSALVYVSLMNSVSLPEETLLTANLIRPDYGETVLINIPEGRTAEVEIYDLLGKRVWTYQGGAVSWDGRGSDGSALPSGVYYVHVDEGTRQTVGTIAVVR